MPNYAARGNGFDVEVAQELESQGYVVGSRRHIGGAGDLLAVHAAHPTLLIECKTTAGGPYERFGPEKRREMREAGMKLNGNHRLLLCWRPPKAKSKRWIPSEGWPS